MNRPVRIPFAEWRPSTNHGFTSGGRRIVLNPTAYAAHSADSGLMADPPERLLKPSANPGSTHLWYRGDGYLFQMVELDEPAWGNGVDYGTPGLYRPDGWASPHKIVRDWYAARRNPNLDCISSEFTGQGVSRGANFSRLTEAQIAMFVRVAEWLKAEGWLDITIDNLILHQYVAPTACPDGRFTPAELISYLGDDALKLTETQTENLLLRLFAGSEYEGSETREQRLQRALAELDKAETAQSLNDTALSAISVAQSHGAGGGTVAIPVGTKFTSEVIQ